MDSNSFLKNKKNILTYFKNRKFDKVIKFGKKLLKKNIKDFQLQYVVGLSYINLKNYLEAEKNFKNVLLINPSYENYYIYGNIQKQLQNFEGASKSFNEAIKLNPNYSEAFNNLGNTKLKLGLIDEAVENYKKAIKSNKKNLRAYFNLAHIYHEEKKFDEVKKVYEKVLTLDNNNTTALNDLGHLNLILGNKIEAKKLFEKVIKLDEQHVRAFKNYFLITKVDNNNEYFKKFSKVNFSNLNHDDKIFAYNCLSKCHFDLENSELALKYLEESNKIKKSRSIFSIEKERKFFIKLKKYFIQKFDTSIQHDFKVSFTPIFIIGMPRSGTTLLEQILSSHSKIFGAGELNYLPKIIDKFKPNESKNFESYVKSLRFQYHEDVSKLSNKKFIIDKLPMNFRWIGFIVKAFPEAKIIHVQRNPMAICWSNYKINFPDPGMDFSLSQKDTAQYYVLYDDLMKFWFKNIKDKIININYENFVNDYQNKTKFLIERLGLNWEKDLKNFDKNIRPVQTASLLQVREKIKKNTSDEWKKFQNYLKIMQETLENSKIKY